MKLQEGDIWICAFADSHSKRIFECKIRKGEEWRASKPWSLLMITTCCEQYRLIQIMQTGANRYFGVYRFMDDNANKRRIFSEYKCASCHHIHVVQYITEDNKEQGVSVLVVCPETRLATELKLNIPAKEIK